MVDPRQKKLITEIMEADAKDGLYGDTNKMVTAVEWLLQQIENKNGKEFSSYYQEFVEQAKEMEKQQIIDAFESGVYDGGENVSKYNINSEQYYNETYNK